MPGFDRTGPLGKGEMTGKGHGRCREAGKNFNEKNERTEASEDLKRYPGRTNGTSGSGRKRRRKFFW